MQLFYLAPALIGPGLRHSGKATQGSLTRTVSSPTTVPHLGLLGLGPAQLCTHSGGCHDDPHTQHSSPSSVHSRQGTHKATSLHKAGNHIPPRAGQGSRPTQARPLPYILVGSKLANKGFPPAWEWGGALSRLSPGWAAPGSVTCQSLPLLLKAHSQVIRW